MPFGFEDPTIHNVVEVTAEFNERPPHASFTRDSVTLTFRGYNSSYERRTEEVTLGVYFAREKQAEAFAKAFAAAINALTEQEEEVE